MKKLLKKSLIYGVLGLIVVLVASYLKFTADTSFLSKAYALVEKSKKAEHRADTIFLGDSVARQFIDAMELGPGSIKLVFNQAISMAGQYILLANCIEANPQIRTVCLVYHPQSFTNNLDQPMTYNYFLKPFYTAEYYGLFTHTVWEQIQKIPLRNWSQSRLVKN